MLLAVGAALAAGAIVHGALHRNSPLFGATVSALPRALRGHVWLTFDDGPNPDATPRVLDALGEAGVTATFFVLGRHAARWPALVRRVRAEGHQLGNHGWSHCKLHLRSPRFVRDDLERGTRAVEDACGAIPRLFRAPHGFRSPWVSGIARSLGQRTVGWTLGVWDSDRPGAAIIAQRTVAGVRPRGIVLLHDGDGYDPAGDRRQTAEALPAIVRGVRAKGLDFAVLPDA